MNGDKAFEQSYDAYVEKSKILFPNATFWSWEKLPEDIKRAWRKLYPAPPSEMKPLSADAQARMTEMLREVLEPAMKQQAQRNPDDFVYTAPEVWMQQVMNVGARIVNRALTIAFKDWGLNEEVEEAHVCVHPSYNAAGNCAEIACDNYAGKYVR